MNSHMSIFRPYSTVGHEDSLTRAALVVMNLVPLAHEAFLGLIEVERLAGLPQASFDLQTGSLKRPASAEDEGEETPDVEALLSVFLSPDLPPEGHSPAIDLESERIARYDGVIQYGDRLLIVIESKLFENSPDWQSLAINTDGVTFGSGKHKSVNWAELLELWWRLQDKELHLLTGIERSVLRDFFDYAEDNFGWLLPFTNLARCGDNAERRGRRLRAILGSVTGTDPKQSGDRAIAILPDDSVRAIKRVDLYVDDDQLVLTMWPGELKWQAHHLYGESSRVEALLQVADSKSWSVRPNLNIAYRNAHPSSRWYTTPEMDGETFARSWVSDVGEAGGCSRLRLENGDLWRWLSERGYASEADRPGLDKLIRTRVQDFHLRPTLEVSRRWIWPEAVGLDERGALIAEVKKELDAVLGAVEQPLPAESS